MQQSGLTARADAECGATGEPAPALPTQATKAHLALRDAVNAALAASADIAHAASLGQFDNRPLASGTKLRCALGRNLQPATAIIAQAFRLGRQRPTGGI